MRAAAFACLLLLCTPLPAAEIPERFRVFSEPVKASMLIGREVRTPQGKRVGAISDLVFDLQHNRVHHALVGRSGYPLYMLKTPPGSDHLVLEFPENPVEQTWDHVRLLPASRLFGARLASGTVVDAVLDAFWGDVAFALVGAAEALRPVPLDAFHEKDGQLVLRVTRAALQGIDTFSLSQLNAHLRDRDFLQRTARLAHQLTPLNSGSEPE
jgi:sporulation protein YlmC with PRC-barrel domain